MTDLALPGVRRRKRRPLSPLGRRALDWCLFAFVLIVWKFSDGGLQWFEAFGLAIDTAVLCVWWPVLVREVKRMSD